MIDYDTIEYTTLKTHKPISPSFVSNLNHKLHIVSITIQQPFKLFHYHVRNRLQGHI